MGAVCDGFARYIPERDAAYRHELPERRVRRVHQQRRRVRRLGAGRARQRLLLGDVARGHELPPEAAEDGAPPVNVTDEGQTSARMAAKFAAEGTEALRHRYAGDRRRISGAARASGRTHPPSARVPREASL